MYFVVQHDYLSICQCRLIGTLLTKACFTIDNNTIMIIRHGIEYILCEYDCDLN